MSDIEMLRQQAARKNIYDPPIGVYVVSREGDFVDCNERVREILQLAPDEPLPRSIKEYYYDPEERDLLLQKMEARLTDNTQNWMDEVIRLKVKGREKFVRDYSRAIFDDDVERPLGFLCCMIDVTEEEFYNRLYKSLPVGLYKLDAEDRIIAVNQAAADMFGYGSKDELESKPIKELYADPAEDESFRQLVEGEGTTAGRMVELQKKDGSPMFASVYAFRVTPSEDEYIGQEGTIMDVTTEQLYRRNFESVPVGLYVIRQKDGKDIITACNEQFARINGFRSPEEAIGFNARELHASEQTYSAYIKELMEHGEEPLHDYSLHITTRGGKKAVFEVTSRLLFDRNGVPIGRAGAQRDISGKANLKQKVEELTEDIGRVLHTYSSALVKMHISTNALLRSFEPDPFRKGFNLLPERASEELVEPAQRLVKSIGDLVKLSSSSAWGAGALPAGQWHRLGELAQVIRDFRQNIDSPVFHPPTLRVAAFEVLEICDEVQRGRLAREVTRQVRSDAREVLRVCHLISMHQTVDLILAMEHPVFALREFVTSDKRQDEVRIVCKVSSLLSQAVNNVSDFAMNRGVNFRYKVASPDALVEVNERDVIRAFDNLLHNAIKYSWERRKGEAPWILIQGHVVENRLQVDFENWGVPIPKDEIARGLIYRTGFRGRLSSDRGRVGTGIGLADARRVARSHGGDVTVKSEPATFSRSAEDYKHPFLTTATITLPLYTGQGVKNEA